MHPDDLRALEEASALATTSIKAYFAAPVDAADARAQADRVDKALILLARVNSARDHRLKELALTFTIAKAMDLRGAVLRPLLEQLTPASAMDLKDVTPGAREGRSAHADPGRRSRTQDA